MGGDGSEGGGSAHKEDVEKEREGRKVVEGCCMRYYGEVRDGRWEMGYRWEGKQLNVGLGCWISYWGVTRMGWDVG